MGERKSFVVQIRDAGQAIVATAAVCALLGGVTVKAWAWVKAGPAALSKAEKLERRTRRVERRTLFMVRAMEKISREKYDWRQEEREMSQPEGDPE